MYAILVNLMMMMMMMMTVEWPKLTVCCFCAFVGAAKRNCTTINTTKRNGGRASEVVHQCQRSQ